MPNSRQRWPLVLAAVVTLWSLSLVVRFFSTHTIGFERAALLVAVVGLVAGGSTAAYLIGRLHGGAVRMGLVVLWLVVGMAGIGGTILHLNPPGVAAADGRQRPMVAPLIFTLFAVAGIISLAGAKETDQKTRVSESELASRASR